MTLHEMRDILIKKMPAVVSGTLALFVAYLLVGDGMAGFVADTLFSLSLVVMIAFPLGYAKVTIKNWRVVLWNIALLYLCLCVGGDLFQITQHLTRSPDKSVIAFISGVGGTLVFIFLITYLGIAARKKDETEKGESTSS